MSWRLAAACSATLERFGGASAIARQQPRQVGRLGHVAAPSLLGQREVPRGVVPGGRAPASISAIRAAYSGIAADAWSFA